MFSFEYLDSEDIRHVSGVKAEGEVYIASETVGLTQFIRSPHEIYSGDGMKIVVNGAGFIQILVEQRREEFSKVNE